ncbi:restriction endonuclease subunit S [Nitrospina gracilis]|nr:restriction endonuclease subunit S [Nitrospina gracilis]
MNSSWVLKKLEDAYDVRDGTHDSPKYQKDGYPLITSKNLKPSGLNFDKVKYISKKDYTKINQRSAVHTGDLLFAMIGTIGHPIVVETDPNFAIKNVALFKVPENQDSYFLKYYLETNFVKEKLYREAKGTTQKFVGLGYLRNFQISLPSLPEQKRIVSILDEAFEGIDRAIANAEKNLANSKELFESYLNNVFTQKGDGWVEKKLDDTCIVERGSSPRPIKSFLTKEADGVNWIKIGDTKYVTKCIISTKEKITPEGALRSRRVEPGDFILTNSMSYGRPYIMATTGYIHDGWFVLRLKEEIDTDFFYHLLTSRVVQEQFRTLAAGAVVKNISSNLVKLAILPIPKKYQQFKIVETIESLSKETQRLEAIYQRKLTALAELKQSLLQKAFSGELTANDTAIKEEAVA